MSANEPPAEAAAAPSAKRLRLAAASAGIAVLGASALGIYFSTGNPASEGPPANVAGTAAGAPFREPASAQPVPAIRFQDAGGGALTLADFKGKTVLLNIWATWCVPCRKEMPALDRLQSRLGGPGFEVVALSIDRDGLPVVLRFYDEYAIRALKPYVDPSFGAVGALRVVGFPTTLLLDREGREIGRRIGPAEWDGAEMADYLRARIGR